MERTGKRREEHYLESRREKERQSKCYKRELGLEGEKTGRGFLVCSSTVDSKTMRGIKKRNKRSERKETSERKNIERRG